MILAAQAITLGATDVVIATTNVGHLSRFAPATLWPDNCCIVAASLKGAKSERPQPNKALHLTASSVRSCVAPASGSR